MESIEVSCILPVDPATVYRDWLSSKGHTLFTGGTAKIEPGVGGKFSAWDGYIHGETLQLETNRKIVQSWTTTEFPEDAPPSRIEILLEPVGEECRLTVIHTNIPDSQGKMYEQGWQDYYFEPMLDYYS